MKPTIKPLPKQHIAYELLKDNIVKYLLFGGGAGGGKSWLGCEWLITNCYFYPGSKWFIGRKELKRLMASAFVTFKKVCLHHEIPRQDWKLNGQYNYIEFFNGSRIDLLDLDFKPSDPEFERLGSLEYTGGWIEEASEIKFKGFDVVKSRIGRHLNKEMNIPIKLLLTCNPKKNWLKRVFYNPWKKGTLNKIYAFVKSLYSDNIHTAEQYGENLSEITDSVTRARLKDGSWDYDEGDLNLIEYDAICDLFSNSIEEGEKKYLTSDIARFGKDKTVIFLWKGFKIYRIIVYEKQDLETTKINIKEILKEEKIPYSHCMIDEDGIGGGVLDYIKGAKGFIANSSPLENPKAKPEYIMRNGKSVRVTAKENYATLKNQCSYMLAQKINNHEIALICKDETQKEKIIEELEQIKKLDPDSDKKLKVIPKEDVKENIGRSPDFSDTMLMRMKFELVDYNSGETEEDKEEYEEELENYLR